MSITILILGHNVSFIVPLFRGQGDNESQGDNFESLGHCWYYLKLLAYKRPAYLEVDYNCYCCSRCLVLVVQSTYLSLPTLTGLRWAKTTTIITLSINVFLSQVHKHVSLPMSNVVSAST